MTSKSAKKVVLAYSGGLDTSVIVPWLQQNYGCEVICFTANIGQGEHEFEGLEAKALASGASKLIVKDLRSEFVEGYLWPLVKSGAIYEGQYLLGTAIARPLIAKAQAEAAIAEGADALAHGCTGKGNDQVRFELTYKAVAPWLSVIAPWREWGILSREDALAYAKEQGIPTMELPRFSFSRDRNLWHMSHEGGPLENPGLPADESIFQWTVQPEKAPDKPEELKIDFKNGVPVGLNGKEMKPLELVETLNEIGGRHGIGRVDMVENRLVGVKSRGIYETPGGTIIMAAHRELESICLDRDTLHYKQQVALRFAELVYFGKWFTPLRKGLQSFIDHSQQPLSGWVKLKLFKGGVTVQGRQSQQSLYREDLATFGQDDVYDQSEAEGFINLFGLQMKVQAMMEADSEVVDSVSAPELDEIQRD